MERGYIIEEMDCGGGGGGLFGMEGNITATKEVGGSLYSRIEVGKEVRLEI